MLGITEERRSSTLCFRDKFSIDETSDKDGRIVIKIPAQLHQVIPGPRNEAIMARPAEDRTVVDDDKSIIWADCNP